jgi:hypothetical protein
MLRKLEKICISVTVSVKREQNLVTNPAKSYSPLKSGAKTSIMHKLALM